MASKKSSKKRWRALFARSRILTFFTAVAAYLYGKAESSITGKIFTSYDEHAVEKSFIGKLFGRLKTGKRVFRPVKRTVSKWTANSYLLGILKEHLRGWLYTKLNVYGLFAITSGIGFLFVHLFKAYWLNVSELSVLDVFVSLLSVILSIPLMVSSSLLKDALCGSKTARRFLFDFLGCKREEFESAEEHTGHSRTALPTGIIFSIVSWWIRPVFLYLVLMLFVFGVLILYIPETGILGLIMLIPFVSSEKLCFLIGYTFLCYFLKYIRGKRTVKFEPLSAAVLVFALLLFGFGGIDGKGVFTVAAFFLTVNLIKSKEWIDRCTSALALSFFLTALYWLGRYFSALTEFEYFGYVFKCIENGAMVSFFDSTSRFAGYIVTVMPVAVVSAGRKDKGLSSFILTVSGLLCLGLTADYSAMAGLVAGLIVFMVLYGKNTMAAVGGVICILPFVVLNMPKSVWETITYRRVSDYFLGGIRAGLDGFSKGVSVLIPVFFAFILFLCLQKHITVYSKGGKGKAVSLAVLSGIFAYILTETDAASFSDCKVCLIFWILVAIMSCTGSAERKNYLFEYGEEELY